MTAVRNEAIGYINEMPEEKLTSALDFLRGLCEKKHPLEITSEEEFYNKLEEGLDDMRNGRGVPIEDAMRDLRQRVESYGV
ncbi:MAG: hypothetical protein FWF81_14495 [Defluviitaleaceae bacterium]|nr:hypothetical protein [Defluviitaleaceae bacterium]